MYCQIVIYALHAAKIYVWLLKLYKWRLIVESWKLLTLIWKTFIEHLASNAHIWKHNTYSYLWKKNYGAYKHHMSKLIKFHSKTRNWLLENFEHNYWELSDHVYEKFESAMQGTEVRRSSARLSPRLRRTLPGDRSAAELDAAASSSPVYCPTQQAKRRRGELGAASAYFSCLLRLGADELHGKHGVRRRDQRGSLAIRRLVSLKSGDWIPFACTSRLKEGE